MEYLYRSFVNAHKRGAMASYSNTDREGATRAAQSYASHLFAGYSAAEMPALAIVVTRECATCAGAGAVRTGTRRTKRCPGCQGKTVEELVSTRVVMRGDELEPCHGACCDGVERVRCAACGCAHESAKACDNPICREALGGSARAELERQAKSAG